MQTKRRSQDVSKRQSAEARAADADDIKALEAIEKQAKQKGGGK